jgi:cyclopropane-fatty-acyl-phospholipid synthase
MEASGWMGLFAQRLRRSKALRPGMAARSRGEIGRGSAHARATIERVFRDLPSKRFGVRFWDGSTMRWGDRQEFTLIFEDQGTFDRLMRAPDPAHFAEAYIAGHLGIEGDRGSAVALARHLGAIQLGLAEKLRLAIVLGPRPTAHTRGEDTRDVRAHYDVSNDFYALLLDERLVYSCAYFMRPDQPIEEAQAQKLDLVCRKLRLAPGDTLLDVGCGWGALLGWAASHYGVRAHGITLSESQHAVAVERIRAAGLHDRVTVELAHYLDLPASRFDKIASVGMYEHVGLAKHQAYFEALSRALKPGGLLLNHGITASYRDHDVAGSAFIYRHIFPGAELDTIGRTLETIGRAGFDVLDVESLRRHYALTLREWNRRLSAREAEAARLVTGNVLRAFQLYLPGCALAFEDRLLDVYQVLAAKPAADGSLGAPLTREDLYRP